MVDQNPYSMVETNYMHDEDIRIDSIKARFRNVVKRHSELTERLSRDSDKMIYERLQREFDAAQASQTQGIMYSSSFGHEHHSVGVYLYIEIYLGGEDWNDGLLATIREKVHMEADRKASGDASMLLDSPLLEKVTYRVGSKVICCLEGARIGIQYETSFAGEPCELYHCVLESKSFLEKMTVQEHTIPFFLPIREAENDLLSSNAMKFIDHVGELLQAYVDRREQVRLTKDLYGNQIGDLYHSLPYHMIEFVLDEFECTRITVSLKYSDLLSVLPTRVRVMAWPLSSSQTGQMSGLQMARIETGTLPSHLIPSRLSYAEDAMRGLSLPEAFAEFILNLPQALDDIFPFLRYSSSSDD